MALYEKIDYIRRGMGVKRFHTHPIIHEETVGHHSANVAILVDYFMEENATKQLIMAALLHDVHEHMTGDVPAQAKWASSELSDALKNIEARLSEYIPAIALSNYERTILKLADKMDLALRCLYEVKLGNTHALEILDRIIEYLTNILEDSEDHYPPPVLELFGEIVNERAKQNSNWRKSL